jgi:endonuclease III-like uncharacterized protein
MQIERLINRMIITLHYVCAVSQLTYEKLIQCEGFDNEKSIMKKPPMGGF